MKRKLSYLTLLLLIIIAQGCTKQSNVNVANDPLLNPQGNFIGTFTLIHLNPLNNKRDTSHALITLAMGAGNTYSVAGDTTKIQAASYGIFSADGTIITFSDATVTKRTPLNPPKKHLNGPFLYTNDGTNLIIYGSSDTLSYNYTLKAY